MRWFMTLEEYNTLDELCNKFDEKCTNTIQHLFSNYVGDIEIAANMLQSQLTILVKDTFKNIHNGNYLGVVVYPTFEGENASLSIVVTNNGAEIRTSVPHSIGTIIKLILMEHMGW